MDLHEILCQQADYTRDSNYKININRSFSWVSIQCQDADAEDHESMFLQGEEADNFIQETDNLWNEVGNLDYDTVAYAMAKPYVDSI